MRVRSMAVWGLVTGVLVVCAVLIVAAGAGAQPGTAAPAARQISYPISYQGRLTNAAGSALANQTVNISFRLYEQASGGTQKWSQTSSVTTNAEGLFTVELLIDPPLGISDLSSMYLGIQVASDAEMTPRQRLGGAPYAFTLVPGNGITGTVDQGSWPGAILQVTNSGSGNGLVGRVEGQGAGVFGSSQEGYGGYFASQEGHAVAVDGPMLIESNAKRIAMHRWYGVNEAGITLPAGDDPHGILFDGGFLWVTSTGDNAVVRRRANDGAMMDIVRVGTAPIGLAYDGLRLWVANRGSNNVTRLMASNPAISSTIAVAAQPNGLCFDGRYIWVVSEGANSVTRLNAATGVAAGTYAVGQSPRLCACDGSQVWITNHNSNSVTVLRSSDGSLVRTVTVGTNPVGILFDGANMWVVNAGSNNITRVRASDGTVINTYAVGQGPRAVTFDGFYVWVTNTTAGTVTKLRVRDGGLIGTYPVGLGPRGITFDGSDIWVTNSDADSITKL